MSWRLWLICGFVVALTSCGTSSAKTDPPPGAAVAVGQTGKTGKAKAASADEIPESPTFPYVNVKGWTGTVTAEAGGTTVNGSTTTVMSYSATGGVTLIDAMTPDGPHAVWPMASAAELTDPVRADLAFKKWEAHVVFKAHTTGVDELGQKVDSTCAGEETHPAMVQVMMVPTGGQYAINIDPPIVQKAQCSGTSQLVGSGGFPEAHVRIEGKAGPKTEPIGGTQTMTFGSITAKVTYKLSAS